MKGVRKILAMTLSIAMIATTITVSPVKADVTSDYQKIEMEEMQINRARIKDASNVEDSNGKHVEVYWESTLPANNDVRDNSYVRCVVEAPEAGEYTFKIGATCWGDVDLKVLVNDKAYDTTLFNGTAQESDLTLSLEEGKNSIIIAWGAWAEMDYLLVPTTLTVVPQATATNYPASAAYLNMTWFHSDTSIYDPEAVLYTGTMYLNVDGTTGEVGAEEWQPSATYKVTAPVDFKQLAVEYYIEALGTGTPSLSLIINDSATPYVVNITEEGLVKITKDDLVAAGLVLGETNTIKIKQTENTGCSFGLYGIEFVTEDTEVVDNFTYTTIKSLIENNGLKMLGRSLEDGESRTMDWTNSGFSFIFNGSGDVRANITTGNISPLVVVVDGVESTVTPRRGTSNVILAEGLETGEHTISVYKTTEANGYLTKVNNISYTDTEATLTATKEAELKFEFVGDSITCGNQIESESGAENGYYAYASILARAYDADWNTISCSGRGLMQGYNSESGWAASKDAQLKDLFDYVSYFRDNTIKYDYSFKPDVLVCNVGSNDLGSDILNTNGTTINDFTAEVVAFHNKVRTQYGADTKIIWCYGTYYNRDFVDDYKAAVEGLNDANAAFVYFPQMLGGNTGHPNYIQHERMAKILSEKVASMLSVENPLDEDLHFEAEDGTLTANGSNAQLKTETGDCAYSGKAYAADMNTETTDYNNAAYVTIPVSVPTAGIYKATITYGSAAEKNPVIAVRANKYPWSAYTVETGLYWDTMKTIAVEVYLRAGANTISITGAINGAWANIDCIDLQYLSVGVEPEEETEKPTICPTVKPTEKPTTVVPTTTKTKKPVKASIKSARNIKKRSVKLTWKRVKNAKSYQVQYSLNRKFKTAKKYKTKTKTTRKLSYTVKKLTKKKTYYFRIRGINGKLKGSWSKSKKIKIRK